jgi:hypothetical protein
VLVTHWDNDHIRGISRVVDECNGATVALSNAFTTDDFLQLVFAEEAHAVGVGTGVDELRSVLRLSTGRRVWAKNNVPLHPRPADGGPSIVAVSPSEDAVERGIMALAELAFERERAVGGRFRAPERANGASVAAFAVAGSNALLLGADLENSNNPATGWDAVLRDARPMRKSSLVKVPHHGSDDAHHDEMWNQLVEDKAIAILAPFINGNVQRPSQADIERLCGLAVRLHVTSLPRIRRARFDSEAERLVSRTLGGRQVREIVGWGHVRARRKLESSGEWDVECDGDAHRVC